MLWIVLSELLRMRNGEDWYETGTGVNCFWSSVVPIAWTNSCLCSGPAFVTDHAIDIFADMTRRDAGPSGVSIALSGLRVGVNTAISLVGVTLQLDFATVGVKAPGPDSFTAMDLETCGQILRRPKSHDPTSNDHI